jgi:hypothetical protein
MDSIVGGFLVLRQKQFPEKPGETSLGYFHHAWGTWGCHFLSFYSQLDEAVLRMGRVSQG